MNTLYNRLPVYVAGTAAMLAATSCSEEKKEKEQQYNIVYIMTDDHTSQMMSCYDNRYVETPNLDRIAADGVKFTNSFVANSLSGPSRACMFTGKHSHANGFYDNTTCIFDGSQQTMPKLLQKAGYQTAIIGKWHLESLPTGFDYWEILPGQGDYYNPRFIEMNNDTIVEKGYLTNIITEKSINWLENQRDKDKPFCLFVHHKACHRNWLPELKYLSLYEDKTFEMPDNFYDDYEGREAAKTQEMSIFKDMDIMYDTKMYRADMDSRLKSTYEAMINRLDPEDRKVYEDFYQPIIDEFYKKNPKGKELAEWKYQRYMRDYAKVLKSFDDNVGQLLDYLEQKGLLKNTLVVYTSDQGFYMGEHGWFDKRFMYEESMRTPLVMRIPDDFKTKAKGEPADWRKSLYYHFYEYPAEHMVKRHYGVRTERYKLIHFYNDIDSWELYDLQEDPKEMNNLYGKEGYEQITEDMMKELRKLQAQYKDPIEEKLKEKL